MTIKSVALIALEILEFGNYSEDPVEHDRIARQKIREFALTTGFRYEDILAEWDRIEAEE